TANFFVARAPDRATNGAPRRSRAVRAPLCARGNAWRGCYSTREGGRGPAFLSERSQTGVTRTPLPIDPVLPELVEALRRRPCAVLRAPTGAGKTTRVPPAVLDAGLAGGGRVVMLEPRRLAARAAARRMADERGGRVGDEIGYQVRFERC